MATGARTGDDEQDGEGHIGADEGGGEDGGQDDEGGRGLGIAYAPPPAAPAGPTDRDDALRATSGHAERPGQEDD